MTPEQKNLSILISLTNEMVLLSAVSSSCPVLWDFWRSTTSARKILLNFKGVCYRLFIAKTRARDGKITND